MITTEHYERLLRESAPVAIPAAIEPRFRTFMENSPSLGWLKDEGGRFVFVNARFEKRYGAAWSDIKGKTVFEMAPPEIAATVAAHDRQVLRTGEPLELVEHVMSPAGEMEVWMVRRFVVDDGRTRMLGGIALEITEQKRLEDRVRVADRMATLGTLAAGVAHEVNNPLAYVIANLDTICEELESDRPGDLIELARQARSGAEQVRKVVRGLRAFSRVDEDHRTRLDLHQVLEQAIAMTATETRHRARVVKQYGPIPQVEADESRVAQVFINLMLNAAQALPDGHADAHEIRVRTSTDHGGRAVVEIEDTGSGIRDSVLPRIFDPFFTTKPVGIGTGLGLSICHGIVAALGGELSVRSQPDKGSVFRVVLPAVQRQHTSLGPRSLMPMASERRAHVLVIDDDALVANALTRGLSREHDVLCCNDAREALALLATGATFDVIFCDLMMPSMTGMDFYIELEVNSPEHCDKTVFITGGAFSPSARKFLDETSVECVEKPFSIASVRAMVRRMVK